MNGGPRSTDLDGKGAYVVDSAIGPLTTRVGAMAGCDAEGGHYIATTLSAGGSPNSNAPGRRKEDDTNLVVHALTSEGADASEDGTGRGTPLVAFAENVRHELRESAVLDALSTGGGKPGQGYPAIRQDMAVRRLTPLECERLQGFPDNWTEGQADSSRYRQLGNAVAVPVVEWIARRLLKVHSEAS